MTLDELIKAYIHTAVVEYLNENLDTIMRERNNSNVLSNTDYITEAALDQYLNEHDYMTRDDVNDQISGATVYIEASLSA